MEQPLFSGDPASEEKPHKQARVSDPGRKKHLVQEQTAVQNSGPKPRL